MALLMSVSQTSPVGPDALGESRGEIAGAAGDVEHALAGRTPETWMVNAFHSRCRPADIRSFIMSYFCATDEKTPSTRLAFSVSLTVSKPKWVSPWLVARQCFPQPPPVLGGRVVESTSRLAPAASSRIR